MDTIASVDHISTWTARVNLACDRGTTVVLLSSYTAVGTGVDLTDVGAWWVLQRAFSIRPRVMNTGVPVTGQQDNSSTENKISPDRARDTAAVTTVVPRSRRCRWMAVAGQIEHRQPRYCSNPGAVLLSLYRSLSICPPVCPSVPFRSRPAALCSALSSRISLIYEVEKNQSALT